MIVDPNARLARVLIVDDESDNRELLKLVLGWEGFVISTAASGAEALGKAMTAHPPDLILLDIMMPGMTGYDVLAEIKADPITRAIPVMMISAMTDGKARTLSLTAGADDFFPKPIDRDELVRRVRKLLRETFPGYRESEK
jgi:CheY-like chemotaxis protein